MIINTALLMDVARAMASGNRTAFGGLAPALAELLGLVKMLTGTSAGAIRLVGEDPAWVTVASDAGPGDFRLDSGFCRDAFDASGALVVTDARLDPRFASEPAVTGPPYVRFFAGVPLVTERGDKIGVLCVMDPCVRHLAPEQRTVLITLGQAIVKLLAAGVNAELLGESEQRFVEMANSTPVLIWVCDAQGKCAFINEALRVFKGRTLEEERGDGWWEGVHPDDLVALQQLSDSSFADRREITVEYRLRRHDGEYRWIVDNWAPRTAPSGEFLGYVGSCLDVTDSRRDQDALRVSRDAYEAIRRASLDGYWCLDENGVLLDANAAYTRMSGFSSDKLIGKHVSELVAYATRAQVDARLATILRDGAAVFETVHRRKDGTPFHVEVSTVYADHPGGGRIYQFLRDVTERRQAADALQASEAQLRAIVETEPECVSVLDADGRVLQMNPAGLAMRAASSIDQLNDRGLINSVCLPYQEAFSDMHRRVMTGDSAALEFEGEALNGERKWFDTRATPMRNGDGTVTALLAVTRDVTERHQLESALLQAETWTRRKVSHELHDGLGQELTGLSLLVAGIASRARRDGSPQAGELQELRSLTSRLIDTCRRISKGLSPLAEAYGGFVQALTDWVTLQRETYHAHIELSVVDQAGLALSGEAQEHLYRIAQESVTNARKHAQATVIGVTLRVEASSVFLEVRDDGVGLANNIEDQSGLGLRIMRYRAARIGARFVIERMETGGTRVTCACPQHSSATRDLRGNGDPNG